MLVISTAFLVITGLVMILSASSIAAFEQYGSGFFFFGRQAIAAAVGAVALFVASRTDHRLWQRLALPAAVASALLLVVVLLPGVGRAAYGSSRWLAIGSFTLQPSELVKFSLLVLVAAIVAARPDRVGDLGYLGTRVLPPVAIAGLLVMRQPDLGTTLIITGSVFLLLFAAGMPMRQVLGTGAAGLVVGMGLIFGADYRRERFLAFLDPWGDPTETGWQLTQGLLAFGSGGWVGVGLGASRQKWLYVPNAHTDFIFAIIGEELGLVGSLVILLGFAVLLIAGVRVAVRASDTFGRLLAAGIVAWFGLQTVVNLGAVTGVLPITGVPLPFISYGGSSLVVTMGAVGVLISIARDRGATGRVQAR